MAKPSNVRVDETHRVFQISNSLRDQIKQSRAKRGETVKVWLSGAIEQEIPQLVAELAGLHIKKSPDKRRPARLPLTDGLLSLLKRASEETSLPQSLLITVAMQRRAAAANQSGHTKKQRRSAGSKRHRGQPARSKSVKSAG